MNEAKSDKADDSDFIELIAFYLPELANELLNLTIESQEWVHGAKRHSGQRNKSPIMEHRDIPVTELFYSA